jgi:hypothetical protein
MLPNVSPRKQRVFGQLLRLHSLAAQVAKALIDAAARKRSVMPNYIESRAL